MLHNFKYCILIFCMFLSACQQDSVENKYTIGFSQCCDDPWRDVMNREMARELTFHPEVKMETRMSSNSSEEQIEQIRELVQKKVDLLIVSPNESKPLTKVLEEVYQSKMSVVLIDRKTDSELYTAYVGANNYEIGKTAGKYLASQAFVKGNIIEIKLQMTTSPAIERSRGFRDAVKDYPNLNIVESLEAKTGLEDISNNLPNILKKHPEANIIFGHTDLLTVIAQKVIQEQGRAKDFFFVGIDGLPITGNGFQGVKNGTMNASLLYPTGGAEAIQTAMKILNKQAFEKENKLPTTVINADNVNILLAQFRKLEEQQQDIERQALKIQDINKTYSSQRNRLYFTSALLVVVILLGAILFYLLREKQLSNKILEEQNHAFLEQKNEIEKVSLTAKQATEEKLRFYSYISHEFRTPLSLVLTPIEDLLSRKSFDTKDTRFTLQFIRKNAHRLLRLVDQFLELRKIDSGKMVLEAQQGDLVAFVKDIVSDFNIKAKSMNIDLQFICPFETLPFYFDAEKLDKVFFNIISNAFKYTPKGGLIHVTLLKNVDKIDIIIADNGTGMTQEEKEHAFDLFYRGNQKASLGSGLGLSLSQEFVNLHKGKISLVSEKEKGTTFKVSLPYVESDTPILENQGTHFNHVIDNSDFEPINAPQTPPQYKDITIVLIEDNPDLNQFLQHKFDKIKSQPFSAVSVCTK